MADDERSFRTPGSAGQIGAASVVAVCGAVLCVRALGEADVVLAVVTALQATAGLYLLVWHVRRRRGDPR